MIPGPRVTLVGHPLIPIGMGEHLRSAFRALRTLGMNVGVWDVYGTGGDDSDLRREFEGYLVQEFSSGVNIFCLNGDEIEPSLTHLTRQLPRNAFNIVYPAWELSKYPNAWAQQLNRFDEVWATSRFTYESIKAAVARPVLHMPLAGEVNLTTLLGRRYFNIPESAFVFLFFFDFTSYVQRKNPFAVLQAFEELCKRCPNEDLCLVIKVKGGKANEKDYDLFRECVSRCKNRVIVIDRLLSDGEIRNLLRCSDSFVSLHRSEGFGLGLIAAMFLGKAVVATGYSGNLDFMNEDNSCLLRFDLCSVPSGAYPFYEGQVWAEPDVTDAVSHMLRLVSDRIYARRVGENASRHVRVNFSYRATGLRYLDRIKDILALQDGASPELAAASPSAVPGRNPQASLSYRGPMNGAILALATKYTHYGDPRITALWQKPSFANYGRSIRGIAMRILWRLYNSLPTSSRARLLKLYSLLFGRA